MDTEWRHGRERGFTLSELVIVLAILAILTALTLSRLSYHQAKSRNTACNAIMEDVKKAAEAYYAETGVKVGYGDIPGIVDADCVLIRRYFMTGMPRHTHISHGGFYSVSWAGEFSVSSCPKDPDGAGPLTRTCFPPGHTTSIHDPLL